jgi:hypothetical protein
MHATSIIAIPLLVVIAAVSFAIGAPAIIAVPVALIVIAIVGALDFNRRRRQAGNIHRFREQAKTEKVDFTERDRETLVSE